MELMQANKQWMSRPDDERFVNLFDLKAKVDSSRMLSREKVTANRNLTFKPASDSIDGLEMVGKAGQAVTLSNWAFGQIANHAGAPAAYLRSLPAAMTADCLNYGLKHKSDIADIGLLLSLNEEESAFEGLRAATGPKYGRVWNSDIAAGLTRVFGDGVTGPWKVPGEFGKAVNVNKGNTTLFASDRDMFVFLADEENRIELPNRRNGKAGSLARGFFVWNSEVGSQSFGIAAFLFDYACSNRIVWGATEYKESRFRHTASAPEKWIENVMPVLESYSHSSARPYEQALIEAQSKRVDNVQEFLRARFTKGEAMGIAKAHEDEEGRPMESLWDVATGVTAYAKGVSFQDERVKLERAAGKILDLAL